jgi:hypothetical protein
LVLVLLAPSIPVYLQKWICNLSQTKAFYKNKWYVKRNKFLDENGKLRTYLNSNAISDSKIIFIFYQILIKENLSPNLESATIN